MKIAKQTGHILGRFQTTIDPPKSIMTEMEILEFSFFFTSSSGIRAKLGARPEGGRVRIDAVRTNVSD